MTSRIRTTDDRSAACSAVDFPGSKEEELRTFTLIRKEDFSGVSGVGRVAEGVEFHDGQCVLSWFGLYHTIEVSPSVEALITIHGHNGSTTVEWEG